ncbi:MAG: DUF4386 domain-containing protein [Paracoccaceae bacterium]
MIPLDNTRNAARLFGICFILTFLSYGIGSSMVDAVTGDAGFLDLIPDNSISLAVGVVLMAVLHSLTNIALPVLMLPILKPVNERLAYGYFGLAVAATTVLAVGGVMLLMLMPLGDAYAVADSATRPPLEATAKMLKSGATSAYHMGMAIWSLGGMMFCAVLYRSALVPRFLPVWGMFGYVTLAAGSISELFFHNNTVEIISVIPGGLFEITLSIWLIIRGFNRPVNALS